MSVDKSDSRTVILIRPIPGLPLTRQEQMGRDAKVGHVYDYTKRGAREIERFIKDARPGDTAMLPALTCLVLPPDDRPEDYKPSADLGSKVASLLARHVTVIDIRGRGKGSISSLSPSEFAEHVAYSICMASQGERPRKPRKNGRAPKGIVARWLSDAMRERREDAQIIWTSKTSMTTKQRKWRQHPDMAELADASEVVLYQILGPTRPGDKRAGGRPRKST